CFRLHIQAQRATNRIRSRTAIKPRRSPMSISALPLQLPSRTHRSELPEVSNQRVQFALVGDRLGGTSDLLLRVTIAATPQRSHLAGNQLPVYRGFGQPWIRRHVGIRHQFLRLDHVNPVPLIAIAPSPSSKVRACALGAELEWPVVHELAGD